MPMLYRPRNNRVIAGVCAGLGQRFDISVFWVRVAIVLLLILPPAAILPYLILWIIIPNEPID